MKKIICSLLLIIIYSYSKSQTTTCASEINLPLIQQVNPARYQRIMALEQHTQNYINSVNSGNNTARLITPNATIIIPVVVHVLHRNEAIGVGRNISVAQIQSQIDVLNEDFRRLNADRVNTPAAFQPVAADPNFEFRLACIDPNGNLTNGITRTFAGVNQFNPLGNRNSDGSINEQAAGIKFTANGGRDAWATNRYLNIWVCDMGGGLIGYGQFPEDYPVKPTTGGVVMLFNAFGRVGNLQLGLDRGKVCIHEIGHWLNLRHIWGDANCGNDFVDDTPTQQTSNGGCPAFPHSTCNNGANGDMFMNYMDYTNNACQNIYTRGQSLRMRAIFAVGGPRANFINNYFQINQPTTDICTTGNITVSNPNCLPVTWNIVSGNAVITGGQGTNIVTVQTTGSGVFRISAATGGYIDERDINHGAQAPTFVPYGTICSSVPFTLCANPIVNSISRQWVARVGNSNVVLQETSHWCVEVPVNTLYVDLFVTNNCGTAQKRQFVRFTYCGSFAVSPNPSSSQTNVSALNGASFTEIRIIDKLGNIRKQFKFAKETKSGSIDVSELPTDIYTIQVFDSKKWTAIKFSKQ